MWINASCRHHLLDCKVLMLYFFQLWNKNLQAKKSCKTGCSLVHENDTETYGNKCWKKLFNINENINSHTKGPNHETNAESINCFLKLEPLHQVFSHAKDIKQPRNQQCFCWTTLKFYVNTAAKYTWHSIQQNSYQAFVVNRESSNSMQESLLC